MKLPLADFYLIRIAFLDSEMAEAGGDIYDYLTLALESQRVTDLELLAEEKRQLITEFRIDNLMLTELAPSSIRNRLFTWEEYSVLQKSGQYVSIPDDHIEVDFPAKAEFDALASTLRHFIEPMLQASYEFTTRDSEFT